MFVNTWPENMQTLNKSMHLCNVFDFKLLSNKQNKQNIVSEILSVLEQMFFPTFTGGGRFDVKKQSPTKRRYKGRQWH